ncbi:UDP-glucose 4-epimerase [Geomicrobium halophilum]|uniref:UDP-glucose 4-epimerase n=1 Tax=Geomicrobium halophilum TaxID=549000 RepID=A0A841PQB8_9BACL|nr:UDP-glucose 4-epimerase GalE [Geomicrobium halophilum]MBB6450939.1 UDP-glucose 4-epimerase [Geomicrobium halophilum]
MSVLVAGGAGYIGSHAVRQLLAKGKEVVVLDQLTTGHREALPDEVHFYEGDLRDRTFVQQMFAQESIDEVLMFAASSLVGESVERPLAYFDNNVHGTEVLLEAMIDHGVRTIVFSSTAAVYGEPDEVPIVETAKTEPTNPYGDTKRTMERMMKWCEEAHGLRYVSLRYFNVAGAAESGVIGEDHRPETHLIPIILEVALGKREAITIFGDDYPTPDGTCIRDYIHVEDLIDAHLLALEHLRKGNASDIFNLGSSNGFSVKEMIEAARKVTGHPIPQKIGERRSGDPARLIASSEKVKRTLDWQPSRTNVEKMIADAWMWHRKFPQGYEEDGTNEN